MNQILYHTLQNKEELINYIYKRKKKYFFITIISLILVLLSFIIYFFIISKKIQNEKISKNIVSQYNIVTLYSDLNKNINSNEIQEIKNDQPFVIGLIQIDKINLMYPILSITNEELLKISPCRFARSYAKSNW